MPPGTGGVGGNPPPIPCPDSLPANGTACPRGNYWGTSCWFEDPCGNPEGVTVSCSSGVWSVPPGTGECGCPATEPVSGTACNLPSTELCSYSDGCCSTGYQCSAGAWIEIPSSCNPPPPECGPEPPADGSPCNPCGSWGSCLWDTCAQAGVTTMATCYAGTWSVSVSPCTDGGA